ncbi:GNAT family N-acetyltransferase [Clostridium felsineum]|uniref:GNAT family N-acetyltransferase n=1 Tax=Clostridium felsineum TaxID=36839 RepID=UPI00098CD592|nr:GNAT family N-acetyltransferase [Clostridium felsineum]URZ04340.1 hypothetical protein CLAUR_044290 [Clostridium felsineum]
MKIRKIEAEIRKEINSFIIKHWFSLKMVIRGEIVDMSKLQGLVMYEDKNIVGLITYRSFNNVMEIMSLDSLKENQGIGTALLDKAVNIAKKAGFYKVKLITTNDNINALRFYQKRGFDMAQIYLNAVDRARKLKPSIPMKGDFDIPIKHEIELEKNI